MPLYQRALVLLALTMAAIPYAVSYAATDGVLARLEPGERAKVVEVVDGDTVLLDDGWQVRLVGIQAPKLPLGRKNFKKWPLADESKSVLEALVLDRQVILAYGGQRVDRHGRRLAHLFLGDETWIQGPAKRIWRLSRRPRGLRSVASLRGSVPALPPGL